MRASCELVTARLSYMQLRLTRSSLIWILDIGRGRSTYPRCVRLRLVHRSVLLWSPRHNASTRACPVVPHTEARAQRAVHAGKYVTLIASRTINACPITLCSSVPSAGRRADRLPSSAFRPSALPLPRRRGPPHRQRTQSIIVATSTGQRT